ncbi:MAG: DUF4314 domain-containing protein [Clostridia bacterium]|nr:DUF4314 domain-containing protein [Clostridia bacterium]
MRGFPTREQVSRIKDQYPIGTVIELTADMDDPYHPIKRGILKIYISKIKIS